MSKSYKLCHRCHLSGKPPQMFFRGSAWAYYILLYIVYDNFIQRTLLFAFIAFIMIYNNNIYKYTEVFFYDGVRMMTTRILYIYIQTKWMGKSHGGDASPPYIYMYNITTTLFFVGIYSIYRDVCGDLGCAYDWYVYTLAPRRARMYIIHIFALCVVSLEVVPSVLGVSYSGWGGPGD